RGSRPPRLRPQRASSRGPSLPEPSSREPSWREPSSQQPSERGPSWPPPSGLRAARPVPSGALATGRESRRKSRRGPLASLLWERGGLSRYLTPTVPDTLSFVSQVTADGRSTRWADHRAQRRTELAQVARRAVHHRGADVSMDEIAAE